MTDFSSAQIPFLNSRENATINSRAVKTASPKRLRVFQDKARLSFSCCSLQREKKV